MYIFLKYIINVCRLRRNRSQFWVFIVIFVLSASKLIRNGYYYLRSVTSVKICCLVLLTNCTKLTSFVVHASRVWATNFQETPSNGGTDTADEVFHFQSKLPLVIEW